MQVERRWYARPECVGRMEGSKMLPVTAATRHLTRQAAVWAISYRKNGNADGVVSESRWSPGPYTGNRLPRRDPLLVMDAVLRSVCRCGKATDVSMTSMRALIASLVLHLLGINARALVQYYYLMASSG